ncbi:DUF4783 domain-containing protein [Daejeonella oryzae]|uniref:DUF4783 domain-containing protein n=1 Tax=Daejeonella oryzae TaxID=1122943 RepID=UPI00040E9719|nr:DUF4783 domain-containing protein [Daejeonella oryzae]
MKLKFFYLLLFSFCLISTVKAQDADVTVKEVTGYLKSSNTAELAKNFASTIELIILSEEDVYSKIQAEIILKDFFSKHQPISAKVIHLLDSNPNYRFAVVSLKTENGNFRISYSLKDTGGQYLITDMRIELEKE